MVSSAPLSHSLTLSRVVWFFAKISGVESILRVYSRSSIELRAYASRVEAIDIFKRLTQTYPTHEKASEAVYFRGQAYSNLKDWDHAIGVYQQLFDKYPDSQVADDGLYLAAVAAQQLKNCTEARTYLDLVKKKYPKSNVTKQVNELDAALKRDLKNKAKCSS